MPPLLLGPDFMFEQTTTVHDSSAEEQNDMGLTAGHAAIAGLTPIRDHPIADIQNLSPGHGIGHLPCAPTPQSSIDLFQDALIFMDDPNLGDRSFFDVVTQHMPESTVLDFQQQELDDFPSSYQDSPSPDLLDDFLPSSDSSESPPQSSGLHALPPPHPQASTGLVSTRTCRPTRGRIALCTRKFRSANQSLDNNANRRIGDQVSGQQQHSTPKKRFSCPFEGCDASTTRRYDLQRHIRYKHHGKSRRVICRLCGHKLARDDGLRRHIFRIHPGLSSWQVKELLEYALKLFGTTEGV